MATEPQTGLTYQDLLAFPEDDFRRELIDGELIVTAAPGGRHQDVVLELGSRLLAYTKLHGGKVYIAPRDLYLADDTVLEPDVLFIRPNNINRVEERFVRGIADIVVEVSSPSTRRLELVRKRDVYQRFGVPEYWFVDLDADRVETYRLERGRYGPPTILFRGKTLTSPLAPSFSLPIGELLGPAED